jgi:hypothetical protein
MVRRSPQFLPAVVLVIITISCIMNMRLTASISYVTGAVSDQVKVKKTVKAVPKVLETELGIKYIELKKGSGAFPTPNDYVIINYRFGMCSTASYRHLYKEPHFRAYIYSLDFHFQRFPIKWDSFRHN